MSNKKMIITIGREYGSGGRIVSTKLAEKLGIAFYDKDLLELAVKNSGLNIDIVKKSEEKAPGLFVTPYAPTTADQLYMAQTKVIKELADKDESCIIVGRCSNAILEGRDDVLNIFLYAPLEYRIYLCGEHLGLSRDDAKREIAHADRHRKSYYQYYTEYQWGDREGFDVMIDTSLLGIDGTVDLIMDIINKKFGE